MSIKDKDFLGYFFIYALNIAAIAWIAVNYHVLMDINAPDGTLVPPNVYWLVAQIVAFGGALTTLMWLTLLAYLTTWSIFNILISPFLISSVLIVKFAVLYRGCHFDPNFHAQPMDYLYFSIITWTTTGYGDLYPPPQCRIYAATEALSGWFVADIMISILINLGQRALTNKLEMEARRKGVFRPKV